MAILRGRAATPIRPGMTIKEVLLGHVSLVTGELVTEASISDLHRTYKELIRRENALRPKAKQLRGMTSFSFKTLFKFAQLLGLVELVEERPMEFPPPGGPLYSIRKPDGVHAVVSTRRIFKLTAVGQEDERSWTNLCRAWREHWPAPAKIEFAPPYVPPERVPVPPPPPEVLIPYKWVPRPTIPRFKSLLKHLEGLQVMGADRPEVVAEVDRLSALIGDWVIEAEDYLDDAKAIFHTANIEKFTLWLKQITEVSEALMDRDLSKAIGALRRLVG